MSHTRQQFGVLLWKNYVLRRRRPLVALCEMALPLLFSFILLHVFRSAIGEIPTGNTSLVPPRNHTIYESFPVDALPDGFMFGNRSFQLAFVPGNSTAVERVAEDVKQSLSGDPARHGNVVISVRGFATEQEFEDYVKNDTHQEKVLAAIVFEHPFASANQPLPRQVSYHLRFPYKARFEQSDRGWHTDSLFGPWVPEIPRYYSEGFLAVQHAVDRAIMRPYDKVLADSLLKRTRVLLSRFPDPANPGYDDTKVLKFVPVILLLSFLYASVNMVQSLVQEKENKLKEYMRLMGVSDWLQWSAWFLTFLLGLSVSIFFVTLLLCLPVIAPMALLSKSDPTLVFVFLLVFAVATINFSFMISTFFSRANVAAGASNFIYILSSFPHIIPMSHAQRTSVCLFSNVAMATGTELIAKFEAEGKGMRWSNLFESRSGDDLSLAQVLGMLLLDAWLYGLVACYVEAVFPGEYGVPLPCYFFLLPSYWRSRPRTALASGSEEEEVAGSILRGEFMEEEPTGLVPGVQIRHLTKEFRVGKQTQQAVRDLTVNMFEGQITVLLGHNGAGKTTTLSMLTGLFPPTSGQAYVNGHDICHDMALVRRSLSLCPQHNILFDNLTVGEHLFFYAQLKGFPRDRIQADVDHLLCILNLEDKRHCRARTLSGGMKRKLSIGIALAGGSRVVMLDEPTTGMDPAARRATLDLLQGEKHGRTIVITTHFMDEADQLGDRVAIMAGGELQCCGSPLFLKNKYGAGYHLVIVKEVLCDVSEITRLVHMHVPNATTESNVGAELFYLLPKESMDRFEELFSELEMNREKLGIASYGASLTTMEEVFLKVGKLAVSSLDFQQNTPDDAGSTGGMKDTTELTDIQMPSPEDFSSDKLNTGLRLCVQQFYAMFLKRALYSWRNWKLMVVQFLLPLALMTCVFVLTMVASLLSSPSSPSSQPNLNLNLSHYGHTRVPVAHGNLTAHGKLTAALAEHYKSQVKTSGAQIVHVKHFNDYILTQVEKEGKTFNQQCVVGAVFRGDSNGGNSSSAEATAYFNNAGYHTSATALWMVDNALFKLVAGSNASIRTGNWPMPHPSQERDRSDQYISSILISVLLYGMASHSGTFALLLITERSVKSKHVQQVSGLYLTNYWFSALLWDLLLNFLLPCVLLLGVFEALIGYGLAASMLLTLMLYGWAIIPLMYLLSFLFDTPAYAYIGLTIFNILSATATMLITLGEPPLDKIFMIFPNHCLGTSFHHLYVKYFCSSSQKAQAPCLVRTRTRRTIGTYPENYFSMADGGVGRYLLSLSVQGVVFMALVFVIELRVARTLRRFFGSPLRSLGRCLTRRRVTADAALLPEDSDVAEERTRVLGWQPTAESAAGSPLVLRELSKEYGIVRTLLAVDRLSLAVGKGECFGLLGFNGAGKTATFKMLTLDESVTSGDAYIDRHSVRTAAKKVRQCVGYCPQFDALLDHMTGRETLCMYARLRGIPEKRLSTCVQNLLVSLQLEPHADKLVAAYSGGSKRKLSASVALIGGPPLDLLDEPSAGMDPAARRRLWDTIIRATRQQGKAVVITTHNMEECEALCTRLAIMVNGQLKCLGSPQHLKSKFGSGYYLQAKVSRPHDRVEEVDPAEEEEEKGSNLQRFKCFVERTFPGCLLKGENHGTVNYQLTDNEAVTWARVFGTMEAAKERYGVEYYSVGQVSLEQVFLGFARFQNGPEADTRGLMENV